MPEERLTLVEAVQTFGDPEKAERWFESVRWPNGVACPKCGSLDVHVREIRKPTPFRCRDCYKDFSVRTYTLMHGTNLGLDKWAMAFYLIATNLKGVSSVKLGKDLGISQKTAWHLMHRIRETWRDSTDPLFFGPVEVDETYVGSRNNKTAVIGIKDRPTGQVYTEVVEGVNKWTVHPIVHEKTWNTTQVYSDGAYMYRSLARPHEYVLHHKEWARGEVHTQGIESFWALLKRGYYGVYHWMSPKHLHRYAQEFAGRYSQRAKSLLGQMAHMARGMENKQLTFVDLVNGEAAFAWN